MIRTASRPSPYDALSRIYDRWIGETDHRRMAQFVMEAASRPTLAASPFCLDVCCGTASLSIALAQGGLKIIGIDRSGPMLDVGRRKIANLGLAHRIVLEQVEVTTDPWPGGPFDIVLCTFDSMNYFDAGDIAKVMQRARECLAPDGIVVFDINSEHKLRSVFGNSVYAEAFTDYAYVWKNSLDEPGRRITFNITMFLHRGAEIYERHEEVHVQYIHGVADVVGELRRSGLDVIQIFDDYSADAIHDRSLRLTFVARKRA